MSVLKLLEKKNLADQNYDSEESLTPASSAGEGEGSEEEVEESAFKEQENKQWKNRARVLVTSGRGTAPGFRALVRDIFDLLPHCKKEVNS